MKKSLGQNFLSDPQILKKIADFARIKKTDTVIEIGPGLGSLTKFLLERARKVIAVEKDRELVERLKKAKTERLRIIQGDILEFPLKMPIKGNYVLVGNIPYYITGEIFRKFLETENQPASMTFVIQKEVAERIMGSHSAKASRDKKKESILSLSIKAYGTPEYGGLIKAGSFSPAPKVDSAIIAIRNISKERFLSPPTHSYSKRGQEEKIITENEFFETIKKGFAHKRKFLRKNLGISEEIFPQLGFPKDVRAEDLTLENWFAIIKACQAKRLSPFL